MQQLYKDLRHVQQRTQCTEKTVLDFVATFEKYLHVPVAGSLRACDKKMQVATLEIEKNTLTSVLKPQHLKCRKELE